MFRCLSANSERQLHGLAWQAQGLLQLSLQQQLPSIFVSLCQQHAVHPGDGRSITHKHVGSFLHHQACQEQGGSHLLQQQHSSSSSPQPPDVPRQHQTSSSSIQQHGLHNNFHQLEPFHQRGYSSISTAGAAHYHSRHSGGCTLAVATPAAVAVGTSYSPPRLCEKINDSSACTSSIRVPKSQPAAASHPCLGVREPAWQSFLLTRLQSM